MGPLMRAIVERLTKLRSNTSRLGQITSSLILIAASLLIGVVFLWLLDRIFLLSFSRSYVEQIAIVFNLNRHLAEAISLAVCVCLAALVSLTFSFSSRKRSLGILGIFALLIVNSLALWLGSKGQFFEASGKSTKCYVMTREGVRFGERPGIDLETGRQCRPVTPDLVERLEQYASGKRPELISTEEPVFFDPVSGEPEVWYARSKSGEIELFDLMGYHPETGEELQPVTPEIVQQWQVQQTEIAQRPPQRIDPEKFTFFDPKTGRARAWFWRGSDGQLQFYDNKGFQPDTGEALQPVTHEIVATWESAAHSPVNRPPVQVDPSSYAFFDAVTGKPRVWYWHGEKGQWEFYDNRGYRTAGGEELKLISQDVIDSWHRESAELKQEAADAAAKAQQEAANKAAQAQQQAAAATQAETDKQSQLQNAGDNCDKAAANPTDKNRPSSFPGVEYRDLRDTAKSAADACAMAATEHPDEPRYRYNWARALEFIDPQQAISVYAGLVQQNYAAAYDSYAGLVWHRQRNLRAAIELYATGARLGDPSAMVSLAYLIQHNLYHVSDPLQTRSALLTAAAQAGDQHAQDLLDQLQQEVQGQQNRQEQQQMMMNMFGAMVRGVAH